MSISVFRLTPSHSFGLSSFLLLPPSVFSFLFFLLVFLAAGFFVISSAQALNLPAPLRWNMGPDQHAQLDDFSLVLPFPSRVAVILVAGMLPCVGSLLRRFAFWIAVLISTTRFLGLGS